MGTTPETALLIIETGAPPPGVAAARGHYADLFRAKLGLDASRAPHLDAMTRPPLPPAATVPPVLLTGSAAFVTDREPWSEELARWLGAVVAAGRPVLGVCYGHQLLATACGGTVGLSPNGREIGDIDVELTVEGHADAVLGSLRAGFSTHAAHLQSVLELPAGAVRLARNDHDANQAFRIGERAWGVQFHPEFDADFVRRYVDVHAERLRAEGFDVSRIAANARDSAAGAQILRAFLTAAH